MAKYTWRIGSIPDGSAPKVGLGVAMRRKRDGVSYPSLTTDSDGFITYQANGHPEPFVLVIDDQPGGSKIWDSEDVLGAGAVSLAELPIVLRRYGDGVVRGYAGELVSGLSGTTLTLGTGGALVAGYPVIAYGVQGFALTRPPTGTRIHRLVARVYPAGSATTPGLAEFAIMQGIIGGSAPALTQTATVHEMSLAQISVPSAGTLVLTDERDFLRETKLETDTARITAASTDSAVGAALSGLSVTLSLPKGINYDCWATVSAVQAIASAAAVPVAAYGSGPGSTTSPLKFNGPHQIAVDSSGNVYVADNGNNRLLKLTSSGAFVAQITGLTDIIGVAVDSSGNIYVNKLATVSHTFHKYNSSFVLLWTATASGSPLGFQQAKHLATDGTHLYGTATDGNVVFKILCSTGVFVTSWGGTGSGNGQFQNAYGIATDGTHVYVSDITLHRIQKFTTAGSFVAKWGSSGSGDGQFSTPVGIALDATNDLVLVVDQANSRIQRFTESGTFVDAFGTFGSGLGQFNAAHGIARHTDGTIWVSEFFNHRVQKLTWLGPAEIGYGEVAIAIDGNVSTYRGIGQRKGRMSNVHTRVISGPDTITVQAFGKATSATMALKLGLLTARCKARR